MSFLTLQFATKEDCSFFTSITADHWWWMVSWFAAERTGDNTIRVQNRFLTDILEPVDVKVAENNCTVLQKGLRTPFVYKAPREIVLSNTIC